MTSISDALPVSKSYTNVPVRWLPLLRLSIILILLILDVLFVLGIPYFYTHLTTLCTLPNCMPLVLTTDDVITLEAAGLSANFYALAHISIEIINALWVNLILLYFLRRCLTHWMGYIACLFFVLFLIMPNVIWAFLDAHPSIHFVGEAIIRITNTAAFTLIFIFPKGYFVPRWSVLFLLPGILMIWGRTVAEYYADFAGTELVSGILLSPFLFTLVMGIAFQVYRYWRVYDPLERQQSGWVIFGFAGLVLGVLGWGLFMEYLAFQPGMPRAWINLIAMPIVMIITVVPLPVAVAMAIINDRLWHVDIVINRTLVYAVVTAIILVTYVFVIGLLNFVFDDGNNLLISLLATGSVALSFQVVRQSVQQAVNRLMFGQRDEPQAILMNLSQQIQSAIMPEDLLGVSTSTIGKSMRVPYVAITIRHGEDIITQAEYGTNGSPTQSFALVHQNEAVGELVIGQRSPGETLNRADQVVLEGIAQQLGAVVYAVRLQSDLQSARERLVITREEERRRLRRDLHDGLGPALASLPLKIDAAIDLIAQDQQKSVSLLGDVKRQAQGLVADVRRVVHDLRPPALDELGLTEALRSALSQLRTHPNGLQITFSADDLPANLPAAVEAATYRITMEAATNVIKHAHAEHCWIMLQTTITYPPILQIAIEDDGVGLPHAVVPNVGLHSMRERTEELGGSFQIQPLPSGGTRITVSLPLSETSTTP
jgi:signal transduction histidine kinase